MIFRLRFKYKYICAVIVFIVIFFIVILFKVSPQKRCIFDDEPIDVVYTWVNGSDPVFEFELKSYLSHLTGRRVDKSKTRYFDRHELKFSLRSLEKFAPWIRNVYIITNGQIPYWLNLDYEKVYIVSHEEIFVDHYDLPSFSSPSIETHLHRIPGLSKKFLYFNDDIYLGAPVFLEDFYSNGHGYLIYLDYPIQSCAKGCPWIYVHDGQCDKECNVYDCQMDGGDCELNVTDLFEVIGDAAPLNVTYLYAIKNTNITESAILSSQDGMRFVSNESAFRNFIAQLPLNVQSSLKGYVERHNYNKILQDKLVRKKQARNEGRSKQAYFDAYRESLQHTNRLFNTKYGFTPRYVPAHMPFLVDVNVMIKLQATFPKEFATTSSNHFRSKNDMQFAFSYFHFLMEENVEVDIAEIFDQFDTDLSGTWSDREIRTVLTRMHDIPLTTMNIDDFDNLLLNCTAIVHPVPVTTPEYERYIDSILPTIPKELIVSCETLKDLLLKRFGKKSKYTYDIIKNVSKYVTFEMIESDIQSTVIKLDKIRKKPTKFVCLNDNVYRKHNESTINAIWYDFYVSLFPLPSKFELPNEYRNRFLYIKDLRWYQTKMTLYLYGCVSLFTFFIIGFLCKNKLTYFLKNKLFC